MAKKNKRNRPAGAPNPQELRQQRLEARRAAKEEALIAQRRASQRERLVRLVLFGFLFAGLFWFIFLRNQTPSEFNGQPVTQLSNAGEGNHTRETVNYESSPPVSGSHANGAGPCGVLNQEIPNETQVHSLEHGAVGVQYQPDLDPEVIADIEDIVREAGDNVFSAPYANMETPIALSSWSRLMTLDELDVEAIDGYIDAFAGNTLEPGTDCPATVDEPFEVPEASPEPGAEGAEPPAGDEASPEAPAEPEDSESP
jgi:hypothetical protein